MLPDNRFRGRAKDFWANIRSISQSAGYTNRKTGEIKVHTLADLVKAAKKAGLGTDHLISGSTATPLAEALIEYFEYRAGVLNTFVRFQLMDVEAARATFDELRAKFDPKCHLPLNKQKGDKSGHAFLTGIVNILLEAHSDGFNVEYDPKSLTTFTLNGAPLRTLARRVDGGFPDTVDPVAIWEIKEYYYTTTFGSRVAGGVYETLLDGMELEELAEHGGKKVQHLLIVDSHFTWWVCGRSYLCRMIDMLHMGYVDEILFGKETVTRIPAILKEWVTEAEARGIPRGIKPTKAKAKRAKKKT